MREALLTVTLAMVALAGGCASHTGNGALIGLGTGAALGGMIGSAEGRAGDGAVVGGLIGAVFGASIGNDLDHYERSRSHGYSSRSYRVQSDYCPPTVYTREVRVYRSDRYHDRGDRYYDRGDRYR